MGMTRRQFGKLFLAFAAVIATGIWRVARQTPSRVIEAVRTRTFPGTLQPLDDTEVKTPARWLG